MSFIVTAWHGTSTVHEPSIDGGWSNRVYVSTDKITAAKEALWSCIGDHPNIANAKTAVGGIPMLYEVLVDLSHARFDPDYHTGMDMVLKRGKDNKWLADEHCVFAWIVFPEMIYKTRKLDDSETLAALEALYRSE